MPAKTDAQFPLVSIVTVNYNSHQETLGLLRSLSKVTYSPLEIFVVDNASSDFPRELFPARPGFHLITSKENLGFAGGNNLAIEKAEGMLILLLNNDTEVEPGFLEPLVQRMMSNAAIGIVSPKIMFYHNPGILQYAGCSAFNPLTSRAFAVGHGQPDGPGYSYPLRTERAHGAAMLVRKEVFEAVGLLPENYFLYYEEMDFCEAAKRKGYEIWYEPESVIYHKESMSVGKQSLTKTYFMARNRLLFVRRNFKGWSKLISGLFIVCIAHPKDILKHLLKGRVPFARAVVSATVWHIKNKAN